MTSARLNDLNPDLNCTVVRMPDHPSEKSMRGLFDEENPGGGAGVARYDQYARKSKEEPGIPRGMGSQGMGKRRKESWTITGAPNNMLTPTLSSCSLATRRLRAAKYP